ncbi:MAG: hypothetical protein A4E64_02897 [Syntrophorhabdus sp. PtaU1.Bin058]|nr:MAG: hypothetical protein A4E64_02897 [Syntrophorhabdus sp. PtaU1.Bin058]
MNEPNIEKLRRFALAVALIVLTYSVAGISLGPESKISVLGMTFKVSRPELLPIGLLMASVCVVLRFYYYGFMLNRSPYRLRRDAIDGLIDTTPRVSRTRKRKISVYFSSATEFDSLVWESNRTKVEKYVEDFPNLFPKFARARASAQINSEPSYTENGDPAGPMYSAKVVIPIRCRMAAIFQDIDYASPVWLNAISLGTFFWRIWKTGINA